MPITKSAKKALRQNKRRNLRNQTKKDNIKDARKIYLKAIASKDATELKKSLAGLYKAVDKAAKTKVISKNKAARLKSRFTKKLK